MASPAWTPTQQVRALLLLHELSAILASEARDCTLHGQPQLAAQLAAVGKRNLPQTITEMVEWSALRLAGCREALRTAIEQYIGSSAWAERLTADVARRLRQGQRFTDAMAHVQDLARAIAADDEVQTRRWFDQLLQQLHRCRDEHAVDAAGIPAEAWTPAVERLLRAASALNLALVPPAPTINERSGGPPVSDRAAGNSSTPYQPSSATEPGTGTGGSHALRRRH